MEEAATAWAEGLKSLRERHRRIDAEGADDPLAWAVGDRLAADLAVAELLDAVLVQLTELVAASRAARSASVAAPAATSSGSLGELMRLLSLLDESHELLGCGVRAGLAPLARRWAPDWLWQYRASRLPGDSLSLRRRIHRGLDDRKLRAALATIIELVNAERLSATAAIMAVAESPARVRSGRRVTLEFPDGSRSAVRFTDEEGEERGTLRVASPLGAAISWRSEGESVSVPLIGTVRIVRVH